MVGVEVPPPPPPPLLLLLLACTAWLPTGFGMLTRQWFEFPDTNAVSGVHNASVRRFDHTEDEAACRALATEHKAKVYTWHDRQATRGYALACVLRLDSVWAPVPQEHHFSALWASRRPNPAPAPTPNPSPEHPKPPPCQLNGALRPNGTCTCDAGWEGPACGQLALLPAPPLAEQVTVAAALSVDNAVANATWGMSVVGPIGGIYHGYMTEIANHCLLGEYGIASQVVHMTSRSPLGPWVRRGVALKGFAHNPQALLAPNGSILIFHIGQEEMAGCLADCRDTLPDNHTHSPHPPKKRPLGCKTLSHGASVAIADRPEGPFTRFPYVFHTGATNPTPLLMANGTVIVALRRATSAHQPLYRGHIDTPGGPWVALPASVVETSAGSPHMYEEDPYIFSTARGFHMLTRRNVGRGRLADDGMTSCPVACQLPGGHCFSPCPDASNGVGLCGGGHLFSTDLRTWFFGENIYGHSSAAATQCDLDFATADAGKGGLFKVHLTARERPTVFTAPDGSRYLFTGAALNKTMYMHSFTLVQEIRMKSDDSFDSTQQGRWQRHLVAAAGHRQRAVTFYGALQSPREHPLAGRRAVSPPEYNTFGPSGIGWMALRGFRTNASGELQDIDQLLDQYTAGPDAISSVLWPNVATATAPNFEDLVGKLNERNLSLMMGGFVPGGRNQFDISRLPHFEAVEELGVRYLGLGQSEQDGRYLAYLEEGKYDVSGTTTGDMSGRFSAYAAFRRYSSAIEQMAGEKLYALDRGVFVHYYLQTGLYTLAGAELSGGINTQLMYAFIRGAAKQYGTLLLSNVCSFTRWGHKIPADPSPTPSCERGSDHGDTCGTSYSSMKRMLYTLMMYDTATAGFEVYYYTSENRSKLTPIGRIQARAKTFADAHPLSERGVHITSTAFLLDYFAGWEAPCAATDNGWPFTSGFGQSAYEAPDFLADGIFDLVWPGYRNAGFYHDASFEMAPTPFGDVVDVLLSDASSDLLSRYDTVIVAHALQSNSLTVADRLERFVAGGGQLTLMFDSLADLGLAGEKLVGNASTARPNSCLRSCPLYNSARVMFADGSTIQEPHPQRICVLEPPKGARVLATAVVGTGVVDNDVNAAAVPVAFRTPPNKRGGSVTVIGVGNYGVTPTVLPIDTPCQVDKPTASPQPIARTVARLLSDTMADQALFDIGGSNTSLSWVPKRVTDTEFILGISNTQLQEQPLDIKATFGRVTSMAEILLDDSEKREAGYLPFGFQGHDIGRSTNTTIAGADFRMIRLTVQPDVGVPEGGINALRQSTMPTAPTGVWLKLPPSVELQESLQRRVTFKQNYDGVLLDWNYLSVRSSAAVQADAQWLHSQRLHAGVDLSSAINLFPGLRLGNFTSHCHGNGLCADGEFFAHSLTTIRDILRKCSAMNTNYTSMPVCRDVFFTLHGLPELGPDPLVVRQQIAATIKLLRAEAAAFAVPLMLHLRQARKNADVAGATAKEQHAWAVSVGAQFAPNAGLAALEGDNLHSMLSTGNFLLVDGVSSLYATRRVGTERTPLVKTEPQFLEAISASVQLAVASNVSIVLDANYASLVEEEADSIWLAKVLQSHQAPSPSPPSPLPPPGSRCYQLGAAQKGICSVMGNTTRHQQLVMGCPSAPGSHCYADYMFANGTWARDYEHNFGGTLTAASVPNATTTLTENEGQWKITVTVDVHSEATASSKDAKGVVSASWESSTGYMQPQDVTSIACGLPQGSQVAFACVCGYSRC